MVETALCSRLTFGNSSIDLTASASDPGGGGCQRVGGRGHHCTSIQVELHGRACTGGRRHRTGSWCSPVARGLIRGERHGPQQGDYKMGGQRWRPLRLEEQLKEGE